MLTTVVTLAGAGAVVVYVLGPLVHDRYQRQLLSQQRQAIADAAESIDSISGASLPTRPPSLGSALGILDIPALELQQVVVEGVGPSQTVKGPGHVPGTAGLGQPGNAVVVGRRAGYGGPFSDLSGLRKGAKVFTATVEGQSEYVVRSVRTIDVTDGPPASSSPFGGSGAPLPGGSSTPPPGAGSTPPPGGGSAVKPASTPESLQTLYGPAKSDQLLLVASASNVPWNRDRAVVVTATMIGEPFQPTPQEAIGSGQNGNDGEPVAALALILAGLALTGSLFGAVTLYRRATVRAAYLLTTAPLFAFTVLAAEAASRLLPAWL